MTTLPIVAGIYAEIENFPCVLLVAPAQARVAPVRWALQQVGFEVTAAPDVLTALRLVATDIFVAILADVSLPGNTAFSLPGVLCTSRPLPVLLIGATDGPCEMIRGIEAGADDCIARTAAATEVVARLKAVLRHYPQVPSRSTCHHCGRFVLDTRTRTVTIAAVPVPFAPREYDLLHLFVTHPRQVFTHAQLFDRFWGGYGGLHTVAVHVSRVRAKIEEVPSEPRSIVTVWGVGYRFEGESR